MKGDKGRGDEKKSIFWLPSPHSVSLHFKHIWAHVIEEVDVPIDLKVTGFKII